MSSKPGTKSLSGTHKRLTSDDWRKFREALDNYRFTADEVADSVSGVRQLAKQLYNKISGRAVPWHELGAILQKDYEAQARHILKAKAAMAK